MKSFFRMLKDSTLAASVLILLLLVVSAPSWADPLKCGENGPETLQPYGDLLTNYKTDLLVVGQCDINSTSGPGPLLYVFHNVNIIGGGSLVFHDDYDIDFYAESILIEGTFNPTSGVLVPGKLIAVSTQPGLLPQASQAANVLPFQKRLTFHLWGAPDDAGIPCASPKGPQGAPCGIPDKLWTANPIMAENLMKNPPPVPAKPKNQDCTHYSGYSVVLPEDDCFYQYEIQDSQDRASGNPAYFGHKVLALSFGGVLQLFGSKGATYLAQGQKCNPSKEGTECNPAFSGTSWVRLTGVTDATHITVNRGVDWKTGDQVVVTTTDYLPSHSERVTLAADAKGGTSLTLAEPGLQEKHNASEYPLPSDLPSAIGPQNDPNVPDVNRAVDTRAAVALLNRNIQVVSQGNLPSDPFTEKPKNYYGGHTIARQGMASFQVQGVEFYQLGQGGVKGRYPVHFHMLRKVPQPVPTTKDPTPEPLNYLKDCSIWDSMTRWVTLHSTEGMYLARNVGFESIGHGYYLEDATEVNNKLYSNIGISARAAIYDTVENPRQVPGILADNQARHPDFHNNDYMPYRSDYNHPTIFWITNGWNDFEYNFAAGAATCGACYWWVPTAVGGPSQYQTFDGYASQQIVRDADTNYNRAGITPLHVFKGNTCVAAMSSFQMNGQTAECLGVQGTGEEKLSAVPSTAPPGPQGNILPLQPFQIYYPVVGEVHNPTLCNAKDCSPNINVCDGADTYKTCAVTHLDHYTSSFSFAQTNFAAVWLRKGWNLVTNSAVTDVQTGGLNFITGGGYTRSDVNLGEWMVARNTALVGHTQKFDEPGGNPFASDVGPFNKESGLGCDNKVTAGTDHCEYADGGVSFNLPVYPGQKLLNIYDGPSQQKNNAYLDINASTIDDCHASAGGTCYSSVVPLAWNIGVLQGATEGECYLPNAAIAWKQPNGFYYPPAFHSHGLWFENVDIRHFVVEPLFKDITPRDYDPFQQNQDAVDDRYCTHTPDMFSANFNAIDRQTVLNDDDGTLTGLVGALKGVARPTISINEDSYFNAPLTTPECLSDVGVTPLNPMGRPFTARTSPYEWLSTAVIADCAISQKGGQQCFLPDLDMYKRWSSACTNSKCRGVPLYREYLTTAEQTARTRPQIRMMGQSTGQRSTMSLNYGAYYMDTTQNCTSQGGCPKCLETDPKNKNICIKYDTDPFSPSVFLGGHTYYVYFLYATATTKQKYDIYVGDKAKLSDLNVTPIRLDPNNYAITTAASNFIGTPTLTGPILTVNVDLTGQSAAFNASKPLFCRPQSYCSSNGSVCGCKPGSDCTDDSDCAWGPNDMDCPVDPANPNGMQCFGFSFTLPAEFKAPPVPIVPPDNLFVNFTRNAYFEKGNVAFEQPTEIEEGDACTYNSLPMQ